MTGIDVSHFQGAIDWPSVTASFAFVKGTDGVTGRDPNAAANWQGASHILRGMYHFFRPQFSASAQAANFLGVLAKANGGSPILSPSDLPCALDLEYIEGVTPPHLSDFLNEVVLWLDTVEKATGRTPIIYTSASYFDQYMPASDFSKYPLWVAEYGVATPKLPQAWKSYAFWQTGRGSVPGVPNTCDLDTFNGTLAELQALAGVTDGNG